MDCDLYCQVIDHFGDAGFSWRLARQWAARTGAPVRLFIDDLTPLGRLEPRLDPAHTDQTLDGVRVCPWPGDAVSVPAAVVIAAFSCELPPSVELAMAARQPPSRWILLDYLSAEPWVGDCHAQPSPRAGYPGPRHFFFPGFDGDSGGLIREPGLLNRRDVFRRDPLQREECWRRLGFSAPSSQTRVVTLFGYAQAPLGALLTHWHRSRHPLRLLIPQATPLATQAEDWVNLQAVTEAQGSRGPQTDLHWTSGCFEIVWIPFQNQDDYDRLLWLADVNLVRGEDSFVRAQWAGRPMLWQAYPQSEDAQQVKLEAFLERYLGTTPAGLGAPLRALFEVWNGGAGDLGGSWDALMAHWDEWRQHAEDWAAHLARQPELVEALIAFCGQGGR